MYTAEQGEAILDLVDQCVRVVAANQQLKPARGDPDKATKKRYKLVVTELADLYQYAVHLEIPDLVLESVLLEGLPSELNALVPQGEQIESA